MCAPCSFVCEFPTLIVFGVFYWWNWHSTMVKTQFCVTVLYSGVTSQSAVWGRLLECRLPTTAVNKIFHASQARQIFTSISYAIAVITLH